MGRAAARAFRVGADVSASSIGLETCMSMLDSAARNMAPDLHHPSEFQRSLPDEREPNKFEVLLGRLKGSRLSMRLSTFVTTLRYALPALFARFNAPDEVRT